MPDTALFMHEALPNSCRALSRGIACTYELYKVVVCRCLRLDGGREGVKMSLPIVGPIGQVEFLPCGDGDRNLKHDLVPVGEAGGREVRPPVETIVDSAPPAV